MSRISKAKLDAVKMAKGTNVYAKIDSWVNTLTGVGTARDKQMHSEFTVGEQLTEEQLDALYAGDDIAARICDVVPEEALRQGYQIKIEASDDDSDEPPGEADTAEPTTSKIDIENAMQYSSDLEKQLTELNAIPSFVDAWVYARSLGGAAIYVGADDGVATENLNLPLNEKSIKSVRFLHVTDKRHLVPASWYSDVDNPKYGTPETYRLNPVGGGVVPSTFSGSVEIHESRFIIFDGVRTSIRRRQTNNGWGDSILQRVVEQLRQFQSTWLSVSHVLQDASQAVFKIQGLIDMIAANDHDGLLARMMSVDMSRSVARAVMVDAELEEFTRNDISLTGYDTMLDRFSLRLAAAARMPVTILMGQSPSGMDATGESDIRWFYDTVKAQQEHYLKPKLERLVHLMMLADGRGVPENWGVTFPPLWQMTPLEEAQLRKLTAETDKIHIDAAVVLPEEVTLSRFPVTGWSPDTTVDLGMRKELLDLSSEVGEILEPEEEDVVEPESTEPEDDAVPDKASDTALNGAQIQSLVGIAEAVGAGSLPKATGVAIIAESFVSITKQEAEAMLAPIEEGDSKPAPVPPGLAAGPVAPNPEEPFVPEPEPRSKDLRLRTPDEPEKDEEE